MATTAIWQAEMIGRHFLAISQVVGDYRYRHYEIMGKAQLRTFSGLHTTLLGYVDQFPVYAVHMDVKKMQHTMQALDKIAAKFQREYVGLTPVNLAITAGVLAVQLGAACLCGNAEAIVNTIEVLNRP